MKICILIPCHNEAKSIGGIVGKLKKLSLDVVVVDDGSTDGTGKIASENGAYVFTVPERGGKGNALQAGFSYIVNRGYDALIMMDGDGQHAVEDVPKFINKFIMINADIINGDRMEDRREMPLIRRLTNMIMSWVISAVCGQPIADSQCGFRLINCNVLRNITLNSTNFEIESEILIRASRKKYKILSVPVQTIYRDEKSRINPIVDTCRFIIFLIGELFRRES